MTITWLLAEVDKGTPLSEAWEKTKIAKLFYSIPSRQRLSNRFMKKMPWWGEKWPVAAVSPVNGYTPIVDCTRLREYCRSGKKHAVLIAFDDNGLFYESCLLANDAAPRREAMDTGRTGPRPGRLTVRARKSDDRRRDRAAVPAEGRVTTLFLDQAGAGRSINVRAAEAAGDDTGAESRSHVEIRGPGARAGAGGPARREAASAGERPGLRQCL